MDSLVAAREIRKEIKETIFGLIVNRNPNMLGDVSLRHGIVLNLVCPHRQYQLTADTSAEILEGLKISFQTLFPEECENKYNHIDSQLKMLTIRMQCTESEIQIKDRIDEEDYSEDCNMVDEGMILECMIIFGDWPKKGFAVMGNFKLDYLIPPEGLQRIQTAT